MHSVTAAWPTSEFQLARCQPIVAQSLRVATDSAEVHVEAWCSLVIALSLLAAQSPERSNEHSSSPRGVGQRAESALLKGIRLAEGVQQLEASRAVFLELARQRGAATDELVARAAAALRSSERVAVHSQLELACKMLLADISRCSRDAHPSPFESGVFVSPSVHHLRMERTGASFVVNGNPPVDLRRRRSLRLLLRHLITMFERQPGSATSLEEIVEAGWPGERLHPQSGAQRAYVAIAALRKMGLRDLLLTEGDGYLLAPSMRLSLAD